MLNGISRLGVSAIKSVQKITRSVSSTGKPPGDKPNPAVKKEQTNVNAGQQDKRQNNVKGSGQKKPANPKIENTVNQQDSKLFNFGKASPQAGEKKENKAQNAAGQPNMEKSNQQSNIKDAPLKKSKLFGGKEEQKVTDNQPKTNNKSKRAQNESEQAQTNAFVFGQQSQDKPGDNKRSASADPSDQSPTRVFRFEGTKERPEKSEETYQPSFTNRNTNT